MGGLFSSPKTPAPDPELAAAQARQEARLNEEERSKKEAIAARQRARQIGGQRMLLSSDRPDAQMGIETKLGAA